MVFLPRNDERLPHARDHFAVFAVAEKEELSVQVFARAMGATALSCRGVVISCKCLWLVAQARPGSRVAPIEAKLMEKTVDRTIDCLRRHPSRATPIVGTRISGPNFNCVENRARSCSSSRNF